MKRLKISFSEEEVVDIIEDKMKESYLIEIVKKRLSKRYELALRGCNIKDAIRRADSRKRFNAKHYDELYQRAEEFRSDLIKEQTPAEKHFKALLKSLKIEYEFQKILYTPTRFYILDFFIPSKKIAYEIDGGYHTTKKQKEFDKLRTEVVKNNGIKEVYRFTNTDVLTDTQNTINRIIEIHK